MSGTFLPTATRASAKVAYFATENAITTSSITTSTITAASIVTDTLVVDGNGSNGVKVLNAVPIVFSDIGSVSTNAMSISNFGAPGTSTLSGYKFPLTVFNTASGANGYTKVGGLIVAGSAINAGDAAAVSAVIDGDINANMNFSSKVLDMKVSTITNTSANFIQFEKNVFIRPAIGSATSAGSLSLVNGAGASNFNQFSLEVNGDGANGGQLALTRFQGVSAFPVFNIDNDGNMLFKDAGATVFADNLSTIALQAGTVNGDSLFGSSRGLLGSFSGGTTGASQTGFLTTGGSSNIAVTQGAVMCLEGTVNVDTVVAGADFGWALTLNNGAQDVEIIGGITTPYKSGGALSGANLPFATTFVAQGANVQLFVTSGAGAGGADTVQANLNTPTLIRVR